MRAMVVDDSSAMRGMLSRMLREFSMEVSEARHGRDALTKFEESGIPELILVDWTMPEMNGLELVRAVRTQLRNRSSVMMMVTTETETSQMVKALAAGANEYLMKPFTKEALLDKLTLLGITTGT